MAGIISRKTKTAGKKTLRKAKKFLEELSGKTKKRRVRKKTGATKIMR